MNTENSILFEGRKECYIEKRLERFDNDSDEDDELSYEENDLLREAFERDLKRKPSWSDIKNGLKAIESDYNALKTGVEDKIQRENSSASIYPSMAKTRVDITREELGL